MNSEKVTAWAAIALSIIALVYSVVQTKEAHRMHRLSLRPLIDFTATSGLKDSDGRSMAGMFQLKTTNNGAGAAFVESFDFFWRESEDQPFNHLANGGKDLQLKLEAGSWIDVKYAKSTQMDFRPRAILRPNTDYTNYENLFLDGKDVELMAKKLLQVRVVYQSVYGERYLSYRYFDEETLAEIPSDDIEKARKSLKNWKNNDCLH